MKEKKSYVNGLGIYAFAWLRIPGKVVNPGYKNTGEELYTQMVHIMQENTDIWSRKLVLAEGNTAIYPKEILLEERTMKYESIRWKYYKQRIRSWGT